MHFHVMMLVSLVSVKGNMASVQVKSSEHKPNITNTAMYETSQENDEQYQEY